MMKELIRIDPWGDGRWWIVVNGCNCCRSLRFSLNDQEETYIYVTSEHIDSMLAILESYDGSGLNRILCSYPSPHSRINFELRKVCNCHLAIRLPLPIIAMSDTTETVDFTIDLENVQRLIQAIKEYLLTN